MYFSYCKIFRYKIIFFLKILFNYFVFANFYYLKSTQCQINTFKNFYAYYCFYHNFYLTAAIFFVILLDIKVEHFVESRATEIQALTEVVKDVGGNHLAFQKLPRHMRRRAMSHNIKRVPRRLHSIVKQEVSCYCIPLIAYSYITDLFKQPAS